MNDWRRWVVRLTAAGVLAFLAWHVSRVPGDSPTQIDGEAFATRYRITYAQGPSAQKVQRAVDEELARIDAMASTWREDSELMRYNRSQQPEHFELSPELMALIERAKQIEQQTDGAFSLRPKGEDIDLSGIAKGYAVDQIVELMQGAFGIEHGLVDIGGEVRAFGDRANGEGWSVGVYAPSPSASPGFEVPKLRLQDNSIATSGAYFKGDHIIDPATGEPVDNNLHSVSVIHPSNATADALATALYVMGLEAGMRWARQHGVHVIFLMKDGTRREHRPDTTPGL